MGDRRTLIRHWRGLNRRTPAHLLEEGELSACSNMESREASLRKRRGLEIISASIPAAALPAADFWASALMTLELPRESMNIVMQAGTSTETAAGVVYES